MSSADKDDVASVAGNAPDHIKATIKHLYRTSDSANTRLGGSNFGFAKSVQSRLELTEVSIRNNANEPKRKEGTAVYRITVDEDMVNGGGKIHGGCSALLIDVCSTAAIIALQMTEGGSGLSVSQSMNIVYHAPAAIGEVLKIVNSTMTVGRRVLSARTEIWSDTHHRLVASGVHIKMEPSPAPAKL